ncbi:MAG: hypothetical protein AAGF24_09065 [Cyanobacteria bacterium P01_H01_bin.121]
MSTASDLKVLKFFSLDKQNVRVVEATVEGDRVLGVARVYSALADARRGFISLRWTFIGSNGRWDDYWFTCQATGHEDERGADLGWRDRDGIPYLWVCARREIETVKIGVGAAQMLRLLNAAQVTRCPISSYLR